MPPGEIAKRLLDSLDQLHRALQDLLGECRHRCQVLVANVALGQAPVALAQIAGKIERAVAVDARVGGLDLIQHVAHLGGSERRVIEELHELLEGTLEVDIVFPERVVGVDDQKLSGHLGVLGARRNGISKTASTASGAPLRSAGSNSHFARASMALASRRSSRWRSSRMPSTRPSRPITAPSRTMPSMPSAAAAPADGSRREGARQAWFRARQTTPASFRNSW